MKQFDIFEARRIAKDKTKKAEKAVIKAAAKALSIAAKAKEVLRGSIHQDQRGDRFLAVLVDRYVSCSRPMTDAEQQAQEVQKARSDKLRAASHWKSRLEARNQN